MWRDRTNLYISYRQSYSHHPPPISRKPNASTSAPLYDERRGLISPGAYDEDGTGSGGHHHNAGSGDVAIEMDLLLPPRWLDTADEVTAALVLVAEDTRMLALLHSKHIRPGFADERDKRREEREIERLTQAITRRFHTCQRAIKSVDALAAAGGSSEMAMARNLKVSLATKVGDASATFRKMQSAYLKKLSAIGGLNAPTIDSSNASNPLIDASMLESENDIQYSQSTLQQATQQRMLHDNDSIISQREREIEDIAQGIIELSNIFQELQTMIIDQGSMLDRVDFNVESMSHDVKEANKELKTATSYQKRSLKRKIMLLLIIIIAGMFILVGLKFGKSSSKNADPPPLTMPNPPASNHKDLGPNLAKRSESLPINLRRNWRRRKRIPLTVYL